MLYQNWQNNLLIKITENNQSISHLHKEIEFFYMLDGELEMTIGNQTKLLTKGMFTCTFPYTLHETKTTNSSRAIMLIVTPSLLEDFRAEFNGQIPTNPFLEASPVTETLGRIMQTVLEYNDKSLDIRMIKGQLYLLAGELLPHLSLKSKEVIASSLYENISEYLNKNFKEEINLSTLSSHLGYNKYYISHIFQDSFHCSFSDLLKKIRVEYAMGLLTHSELSITDICYESGFSSTRSFYRAFQEIYHQTPGSIRDKMIPPNND